MSTMLNQILDYTSQRMVFAQDFIEPLLASAGTHLLQLLNDSEPFFYANGKPERMNLSSAIIAPPGCSKSLSMSLLLGNDGILPIESSTISVITEAGLVGTNDDEGNQRLGLAHTLRNGIIVLDELSALLAPGLKEENVSLLNCVLTLLSEGKIEKKLARCHINYPSNMSLWGGVQISSRRFDFTSGLPRRLLIIFKRWTLRDFKKIIWARNTMRGFNKEERDRLRAGIKAYIEERKVKEVQLDEKLLKWVNHRSLVPAEAIKFEKIALGYSYWNCNSNTNKKILEVKKTKELVKFLNRCQVMWMDVFMGTEYSTLKSLLAKNAMERSKFYRIMGSLGYTEQNIENLLVRFSGCGFLTNKDNVIKWKEGVNNTKKDVLT